MTIFILINIIYFILCINLCVFEDKIPIHFRQTLNKIMLFVFGLIMGFRPIDTKDTEIYYYGFYNITFYDASKITIFQKYESNFEVGYIYLMNIFKYFSNSPEIFFSLCSITTTFLTYHALKNIYNELEDGNKNIYFTTLAFYMSSFALHYSGIAVRAGLSIAIGLNAILYIIKNKKIIATILFFLAFTIQRSSVVLFFIYLIWKYFPTFNKKYYIIFFVILCFLFFSNLGSSFFPAISNIIVLFMAKYEMATYASYLKSSSGIAIKHTYFLLLFGICIFIIKTKNEYKKIINIIMFGAIIIAFMHQARAVSRLYEFFYMFSIPLLANSLRIKNFSISKKGIILFSVLFANYIILLDKIFA